MKTKTDGVAIIGTGSYLPEKILTNFDLEKMVDTSDEWITQRTGIKERRIADDNTATSDLATRAALRALEDAEVAPADIDLIIVATVSPDHFFPSTACSVQDNIGATKAGAFDLSAACAGFVYGLSVGADFAAQNDSHTVLVIGAETLSKFIDYTDRASCILFGDGAGAAVLRKSRSETDSIILMNCMGADGSQGHIIRIPAGGSRMPVSHQVIDERRQYLKISGREVFKFAVLKTIELVKVTVERCGLTLDDIDLIVPHQVNSRIIESAMSKLGIPMERVYINIHKYGNTSAASVPIALNDALREGRLKKNDMVLMVAFGAGLTWGSCVVRW